MLLLHCFLLLSISFQAALANNIDELERFLTVDTAHPQKLLAIEPCTLPWVSLPRTDGSVSPEELNALYALYNATNGDNWLWKPVSESGPQWNFTSFPTPITPCENGSVWQGLTCLCPSFEPPQAEGGDDDRDNDRDDGFGFNLLSYAYCVITSLSLSGYGLVGSLPSTITNLTQLTYLDLSLNSISSTIPSLDSLTQIQILAFNGNKLTGPIPYLDSLKQLNFLYLNYNTLTGSIPSLDSLSHIQYLDLSFNALNGSIPSLDRLNELRDLRLYNNNLIGSIPSLDSLSQLELIFLSNNELTGSIPSLDSLANMTYLFLYNNFLSSTMPSLENMPLLNALEVSSNYISGPIPTLDNLPLLQRLFLDGNLFTGRIPALDSLSELELVFLGNNELTGSVPPFAGLNRLEEYDLQLNVLTGSIPSLHNLSSLLYLQLYNNALTGSIDSLASLFNIHYLFLFNNALTGPIPSLTTLTELKELRLENNAFTGPIPSVIPLYELKSLQLQNNRLTGKLDGLLSPQNQGYLTTIQLSANYFSGTVPAQIFELPALQTFAIVSNCMRGPLPLSTMCSSKSVQSLLLDGLHTASSCRIPLLGTLVPRLYVLDDGSTDLSDQLDPCLFFIPTLSTLHMSGNGLEGTIPNFPQDTTGANITNRTNITDLALSHNKLVGTIPKWMQKQTHWDNLDLSYNRLNGELISQFSECFETDTRSSISLNLNRISGYIPKSLKRAGSVTILSGNMFSCNNEDKTLPVHDEERSNYSCGSNTFNSPYYAWISVVGCVVGFSVVVRVFSGIPLKYSDSGGGGGVGGGENQIPFFIVRWWETRTSLRRVIMCDRHANLTLSYKHILRLEQRFDGIRQLVRNCGLYILGILAPLYIVSGLYSSTYTYRYAWTVSTSFLTGSVTAVLLLCALMGHVCVVALQYNNIIYSFVSGGNSSSSSSSTTTSSVYTGSGRSAGQRAVYTLPWLAVIVINLLVVGLSNVGFVWVSVYHGNRINLFAAQVTLAIVKYVWNSKMLRVTIRWFVSLVSDLSIAVVSQRALAAELYLAVFNNVIIPCFVVAMIDPDCFYSFLVPPPKVTATYTYDGYECSVFLCGTVVTRSTTSFDPPFSYSYQCSASFTTHYATAFLYTCVITGIVVPLWELLLMYMYSRLLDSAYKNSILSDALSTGCPTITSPFNSSSSASSSSDFCAPVKSNAATTSSTVIALPLEKPHSGVNTVVSAASSVAATLGHQRSPADTSSTVYGSIKNKLLYKLFRSGIVPSLLTPVTLESLLGGIEAGDAREAKNENNSSSSDSKTAPLYFDSTQYLTTVIILLALLFTFGAVFPPLGFAIIVTVIAYTFVAQFKLARFISLSVQAGLISQVEQVGRECSAFLLPSEQGVWVLATIACWFYAFILFDTLGNSVGFEGALWILCLMLSFSIILYFCDRLLLCWYARHDSKQSWNTDSEAQRESGATESANEETNAVEMGRMTLWAHTHMNKDSI